EQRTFKAWVAGSNPAALTIELNREPQYAPADWQNPLSFTGEIFSCIQRFSGCIYSVKNHSLLMQTSVTQIDTQGRLCHPSFMPIRSSMNVSLTPELEKFVQSRVASGRYQTASEVIREGLRLLEER